MVLSHVYLAAKCLALGLMQFQVNARGTSWDQNQAGLVTISDYQKFDDMLRMVIASRPQQTQALIAHLKSAVRAGHLAYGAPYL